MEHSNNLQLQKLVNKLSFVYIDTYALIVLGINDKVILRCFAFQLLVVDDHYSKSTSFICCLRGHQLSVLKRCMDFEIFLDFTDFFTRLHDHSKNYYTATLEYRIARNFRGMYISRLSH